MDTQRAPSAKHRPQRPAGVSIPEAEEVLFLWTQSSIDNLAGNNFSRFCYALIDVHVPQAQEYAPHWGLSFFMEGDSNIEDPQSLVVHKQCDPPLKNIWSHKA